MVGDNQQPTPLPSLTRTHTHTHSLTHSHTHTHTHTHSLTHTHKAKACRHTRARCKVESDSRTHRLLEVNSQPDFGAVSKRGAYVYEVEHEVKGGAIAGALTLAFRHAKEEAQNTAEGAQGLAGEDEAGTYVDVARSLETERPSGRPLMPARQVAGPYEQGLLEVAISAGWEPLRVSPLVGRAKEWWVEEKAEGRGGEGGV